MHEKLMIVGAGSAVFMKGLVSDLLRQEWEGELRLVDTDPQALAVAEKLAAKMLAARKSHVKLSASVDRRELMPGTTAVVCTIGVGGRRAWEQDVFIPRRYGIYQPVGDSVMPGGSSRALRMIPAMVAIAEDVLDLAPAALFFNYGNPMGPVCRAVRKATGAEMIGLCHGVFSVAYELADLLGVPRERLNYTALGMNHLTWFTELSMEGADLMPRLLALADSRPDNREHVACFIWELTRLFRAFPAVGDRHTTEFFPWLFSDQGSYYGWTPGVEPFSFEGTIAAGDREFAEMTQLAESPDPLPADFFAKMGGEHEQVIDIIESIRFGRGKVYSANLPNRGQLPNLPDEAIVECPAITAAGGLRPIQQRPLPSGIAGTLATRLQWVETIVEAALERSRRKFVQALLLDGAVKSIIMAEQLADDLLASQATHLQPFVE
jgi:alpha-galactosidase